MTQTAFSKQPSQCNSFIQDDSSSATEVPDVESPSLSYLSARARFEFEPRRGNEGTKILMIEWEDDDSTKNVRGTWTVSWEGKTHVLPAEDRSNGNGDGSSSTPGVDLKDQLGKEHRLFFLLPPGVNVPPMVTLTLRPESKSVKEVVWKTNPLPAIFPPGLATAGVQTQGKGVLHTLWAKKRLQTLAKEIEHEAAQNVEGVALAMAIREKEWIESSFGVTVETRKPPHRIGIPNHDIPISPASPMSPGGSRLAEKLRGLKIQTSEGDLKPRSSAPVESHILSPEETDVAVPSLSAFRGANPDVLASKPARAPASRRIPSASTPANKVRQELSMGSLGGMISNPSTASESSTSAMASAAGSNDTEEEEKGLFALPLSPRSPDMTKSPFSFAGADTAKYVKGQQRVA